MYLVTGANGQLGRAIVHRLVARVPASQVIATCRNPAQAADLVALGVQVRQADFAEPQGLRQAFAGARQVLIVSSNARAHGGDTQAQHRTAIAAACDAGAERITYTSHMAASANSAFPPMHDHAATEALLAGCGTPWTALRHGFYAASGIAMLAPALQRGVLDIAADGPVAWTAHADLAEAAAHYLVQPPSHSGPTTPLTGGEALDMRMLCDIVAHLAGRPVTCHGLADDAMRATLAARGLPAPVVAISMGFYQAARAGEFARLDPTLARLLGRPPLTMRDLLAQKLGQG